MPSHRTQLEGASADEAFAAVVDRVEDERRLLDIIPRDEWMARWKQRGRLADSQRDLLWAETRQMGRRAYIWRHGVFGYGLAMFVTMEILLPVSKGRLPASIGEVLAHMLYGAFTWLIGGYVFGVWTWRATEKHFLKSVRFQSPPPR